MDDLETRNVLSNLISDEIYFLLQKNNFFDKVEVRNYVIRQDYHFLRGKGVSTEKCVEKLQNQYPYLSYDTVKKIAYSSHK